MGSSVFYGKERGNAQVFLALRDVGVDALFLTHAGKGRRTVEPALDRLGLRWTPVPYPRRWRYGLTPQHIASGLRKAVACNRAFRRHLASYRPTHVHLMSEHFALNLAPSIRALDRPLIYRAGDQPLSHHPLFRAVWRHLLIPKVTQFVAISEFVRDSLIAVGVPHDRIRVIYNYPPARPPLQRSDLPTDIQPFAGRTVVYVGQISRDKGVDKLVEAALGLCRERTDVRFLIAGEGPEDDGIVESLKASVQASDAADRIRFLGFIEDVPGLLARADIHVAPSVCAEALSNVVPEAKQAGVPSVVFPSGGLPELCVSHGQDTFVCNDKTAVELATGLRHYLDMHNTSLTSAGAAARMSLAALGITREAYVAKWASVYGVSDAAPPPLQSYAD